MTDISSSRSLRVFLCHSSADKPAVRELYQRLCADGVEAWLAEENLLPGQDWQLEIPKAVRESDAVIVCLSTGAINKAGYVQKEIKFALDVADAQPQGAIFLIPVRLEECDVPERLSRWQWVNLFSTMGYERLLKALRTRANSLGMTPPSTQSLPSFKVTAHVAGHNDVQVWSGLEFVRIPPGKFLMGSQEDNRFADENEKPQHSIEIPYDYWMARCPVTYRQFSAFVAATQAEIDLSTEQLEVLDHPVVKITWHEANAYSQWLNQQLADELRDLTLRLPTEAEWEKAARGVYGYEWPWGNEWDAARCNSVESDKGVTTPVGAYSPRGDSPYGVADMVGNIWEWCHSLDRAYPYSVDDGRESEADVGLRVVRGGAYRDSFAGTRCAYRSAFLPHRRHEAIGFRVVIAPRLS
jgi:formylglycine-generating enzyme required for sulfatase activity